MTLTSAATNVVLGAGPVGTAIARRLAEAGETVRVVTRTGRDPGIPGMSAFPADITDAAAVRAATEGASRVYFAAQPAYTNWPRGFPPLVEGVLSGLKGRGVRLVVVDNLYAYGPTGGVPMREDLPYRATNRKGTARARVAERFMAAHAAGDVPVVIARASDYFGPGAVELVVGERFFGRIVAGKAASVFGDPDAPHSVTYVPDFAAALIALAQHEEAFGQAWHVPSAPAVSFRRLADLAGCRRGNGNAPPQPALPPDAATCRSVRPGRARDDRDALRVRDAVHPRQLEDRAGARTDPDAVRNLDPGHGGLVAGPPGHRRRPNLARSATDAETLRIPPSLGRVSRVSRVSGRRGRPGGRPPRTLPGRRAWQARERPRR